MNDNYNKLIDSLYEEILENSAQKSKLDRVVDCMRSFWWKYVIYTITTGILALFIASLVLDKSITISIMNSWIGIILGLVALIIGIISMFLSFYNLDQSIKTQQETVQMIDNLRKEIIEKIDKSFKETQDVVKENAFNNGITTSQVSGKFTKIDSEFQKSKGD
ncbi:hypothetical protein [uncultured Thomasclavelia sp.]|uniref:hypothetical protein n=1 Tax=uncultured Thomasclavelia sp. TaxID=3025759 RepID=UPI0026391BEB|nr:hypothetical protein [uncultured Thomasclavelia sp.]